MEGCCLGGQEQNEKPVISLMMTMIMANLITKLM